MSVNPPKDSDVQSNGPGQSPLEGVLTGAQRVASAYLQKRDADRNIVNPQPTYDPVTRKRYFLTAPTPLKRQLSSPLATKGSPNAVGPHGERYVTSGWGDKRTDSTNPHMHQGLDFRAPVGEQVLACADGTVSFVGVSIRGSAGNRNSFPVSLTHPQADANGNVTDDSGASYTHDQIGDAGIYVKIEHTGDFAGYTTEYMHLSEALVAPGFVHEGTVIGKVGRTGGFTGITEGPHLHWQVKYQGVLVRPDSLVPYYWKGHPTPTQGTEVAALLAAAGLAPVGLNLATQQLANLLQCQDRATAVSNFGGPDLKQQQADHSERIATNLNIHITAAYDAIAKFQGSLPVVDAPMTFDFDRGVWTDGKAV